MSAAAAAAFGHALLPKFAFEEGYCCLNHGSFGSTPLCVTRRQQELALQMERCPDRWFRAQVYDELAHVRGLAAAMMSVPDPDDVVFLTNATHAFNAVVQSLLVWRLDRRGSAPAVVYTSVAYQSLKNVLKLAEEHGFCRLFEAALQLPLPADCPNFASHVTERVAATIERAVMETGRAPVLGIVDHISSIPALVFPVQQLVDYFHNKGIPVMVDGAHALGHVTVNISELKPDFYLTNAHKWMFVPRGCALLYVDKQHQDAMYPPIISHMEEGRTLFQRRFFDQGTSDYSHYLALGQALEFVDSLGGVAAVREHNNKLAVEGAALLASEWGTDVLCGREKNGACSGAMMNVRLPLPVQRGYKAFKDAELLEQWPKGTTYAELLERWLLREWHTYVPVFLLNNELYIRISAQVFNELSDFQRLADAITPLRRLQVKRN
eukprot:TRINITY_DN10447_c0_g1_i1.p1 TRINITY_DN10447_c0_g1~~TRINITY_DN10447_c0_g1_i1.p1  ORF type:complete len:437 (-),score=99.42 TRINITY_DN10447_c0_g1_i1:69-1379(-)